MSDVVSACCLAPVEDEVCLECDSICDLLHECGLGDECEHEELISPADPEAVKQGDHWYHHSCWNIFHRESEEEAHYRKMDEALDHKQRL